MTAADQQPDLHPRAVVLATDVGFCEGPVVTRSGELICVSWDHGRLYEVADGAARVRAELGVGANGATEGPDGRLFIAQSGGQAPGHRPAFRYGHTGGIQVVDHDGTMTWLTMDPIRPNDLCFGPDGALWVTDPHQTRRDDGRIWRFDADTGVGDLLTTVDFYTNGLGFGPSDDVLFVADTYGSRIVTLTIDGDRLGAPQTFAQLDGLHPDGFAFDTEGNIVVGAVSLSERPGEVQVYSPGGELLDRFMPGPGSHFTNVALTPEGALVICDSRSGRVLAVPDWGAAPLALHPRPNPTTTSA